MNIDSEDESDRFYVQDCLKMLLHTLSMQKSNLRDRKSWGVNFMKQYGEGVSGESM